MEELDHGLLPPRTPASFAEAAFARDVTARSIHMGAGLDGQLKIWSKSRNCMGLSSWLRPGRAGGVRGLVSSQSAHQSSHSWNTTEQSLQPNGLNTSTTCRGNKPETLFLLCLRSECSSLITCKEPPERGGGLPRKERAKSKAT